MESRYIKTHRSRDLKRSILFIAKNIVESLMKSEEEKLENIFLKLHKKISLKERDFMLALNFLFALGVIDYDKNCDILRYLK